MAGNAWVQHLCVGTLVIGCAFTKLIDVNALTARSDSVRDR